MEYKKGKCNFPTFLEIYDRQTDQPTSFLTNQPTNQQRTDMRGNWEVT